MRLSGSNASGTGFWSRDAHVDMPMDTISIRYHAVEQCRLVWLRIMPLSSVHCTLANPYLSSSRLVVIWRTEIQAADKSISPAAPERKEVVGGQLLV